MDITVIMHETEFSERRYGVSRNRRTAPSFEVSMEFESVDPTSATLLGRVGLSPSDHVAWERFVGVYGSKIRGWCRRWGLQEADTEDVTQDVLLRLAQKLGTFQYDPVAQFPRLAEDGDSKRPGRFPGACASVNVPAAATTMSSPSSRVSRHATT